MAPVKHVVETRYTDKEKLLGKLKAIFPNEANTSFKIRVSMTYLSALVAEIPYARSQRRLVEIVVLDDPELMIRQLRNDKFTFECPRKLTEVSLANTLWT